MFWVPSMGWKYHGHEWRPPHFGSTSHLVHTKHQNIVVMQQDITSLSFFLFFKNNTLAYSRTHLLPSPSPGTLELALPFAEMFK